MLHRFIATALLAAALTPAIASAQLFDNGAPNSSSGNEMTQWIQAEDFALGTASTITSIRFWAFQNNANAYQGSIVWQVYSNNAGIPGSMLFTGTSSSAPVDQGPIASGGQPQLQFDMATNFNLGAGTYWLGLHNGALTTTSRTEFYWQTRANNATLRGREDNAPFGDNLWADNTKEHAFQLYGTNTVVPEPSTYALLATGLAALLVVRRRRRV